MAEGSGSKTRATQSVGSNATAGQAGVLEPNYHAELERRLREALDEPQNLLANLKAEVEFRITLEGRLVQAKLLRGSGDERFDRAVMLAVANTRMPPPPSQREEVVRIPFTTRLRGVE